MAAMALITDPDLVILDEPTTALDVTTQVEVLRVFRRAVRERRTTAVYVRTSETLAPTQDEVSLNACLVHAAVGRNDLPSDRYAESRAVGYMTNGS